MEQQEPELGIMNMDGYSKKVMEFVSLATEIDLKLNGMWLTSIFWIKSLLLLLLLFSHFTLCLLSKGEIAVSY